MDIPAVCLLLLKQGDRSLEDHTRDFLDLACLTHYLCYTMSLLVQPSSKCSSSSLVQHCFKLSSLPLVKPGSKSSLKSLVKHSSTSSSSMLAKPSSKLSLVAAGSASSHRHLHQFTLAPSLCVQHQVFINQHQVALIAIGSAQFQVSFVSEGAAQTCLSHLLCQKPSSSSASSLPPMVPVSCIDPPGTSQSPGPPWPTDPSTPTKASKPRAPPRPSDPLAAPWLNAPSAPPCELHIGSVRYEDTGAYTCIARNEVGVDEDISSLFVEDSARKTRLSVGNMFYVFYSHGIIILQPGNCEIRRRITRTERILGSDEELCPRSTGVSSHECVWASAVSVRDKYVYVTQPLHNRLLLIDTQAQRVVQAVETDAMPVKLFYDKSHDQLWVLSWRDLLKSRSTLQVITSASAVEQRQIVHTPFERVEDFYIPPTNLIITHVRFGFVFLKSESAVHKIDLETLHLVKTISLKNYSCIPASMAYTHLSGYYFIECQVENRSTPSSQILIDSVSDTVIGPNPNINGQPFISPDGRFIVSVDKRRGKLQVQTISFSGELQISHEVDVSIPLADLEFQPSFTEANQYVVVTSSAQGSELVFSDLATGRAKALQNVKDPIPATSWPWGDANRVVVSSGVFGRYLVTSSAESLFVLDGKQSGPHCEVSEVKRGNTVVWVGEV
ncbi:Follistatin-related protein 4 [Anabarilius grahami]|uniref:Follistatin-related protein 4 n=1 Tax=Anabarilius grahami TaxID=495550 RepID=A0A3N0XUD8_ANAGA|nr:Follistatin-related protein 4 [Anabarilius grahami]